MSSVQSLVQLTVAPKSRTRTRVYACALCEKKFFTLTDWCPACGGDKTLYLVPEDELDEHHGLIRADSYVLPERNHFKVGEWGGAFPKGYIPGGTILVLRGAPGAGKTRLALRLGTKQRLCTCLELELPIDDALETAESCGADMGRLLLSDNFRGLESFDEAAKEGSDCLIIDSIQKLDSRPGKYFDAIRRFAKGGNGGRLVIVITQSNAKGGTRGGLAIEYDLAETMAMVRPTDQDGIAEVTVEKNRRGKCPTFEASKLAGAEPRKIKRIK